MARIYILPKFSMGSLVPLVSIAIPTYRGEAHIADTIESVLGQSFGDFELIIVDDNSSDRTLEIARRFTDPRIRILCNEANLGPEAQLESLSAGEQRQVFQVAAAG